MPRGKDAIWDDFDSEPNPAIGKPWAKCRMCDWRHAGIASRMKAHIEKHRSRLINSSAVPGATQKSWLRISREGDFIGMSRAYKSELDIQIARYFYATNTPFSHAEHPEFKAMFSKARPGYTPPTRHVIGNKLLDQTYAQLYEEGKTRLSKSVSNTVTMALDGWSNVHNEPIVGISIVDAEGNPLLVNSVDTSSHSHVAEYLLTLAESEIERCEDKFNVRVGSFVTDNTGNVTKMRRMLAENMEIIQYGCNSHIFNLLSGDLKISKVKSNVQKIIRHFRNTHLPNAWYKQRGGTKLVLPSTVRWNTIHGSIKSFLKNRGILIQVTDDHPNEIDQTIVRLVNDIKLKSNCQHYTKRLHPIAIALDRSQRDSTTIAVVVEIWHKLEKDLKEEEIEILQKVQNRKTMALNAIHFLANVLDHRFRGAHLSELERNMALEKLYEIDPKFLPIALAHMNKAEPFPSYMYADSLRQTNPITWWKTLDLTHSKSFCWKTLKDDLDSVM